MTDRLDAETRSSLMSRVRQKGTAPELAVRKLLRAASLRYRTHPKHLPGTPDVVLTEARVAIFVHGCFWHGHDRCKRGKLPEQNSDFWASKIARNRRRDRSAARQLRKRGWSVATVWECQLRNRGGLLARITRLVTRQKCLHKRGGAR